VNSDLEVAAGLVIPAAALPWKAVRSGGPGGQNVNKVATKVELRFDFASFSGLSAAVKARLRILARGQLDAEGSLLVTSQLTRSQSQNLALARSQVAALVRAALVVPKRRRPTKPTKASKARRLDQKRKTSDKKRARRSAGSD
jgi:ribosome-associated protein